MDGLSRQSGVNLGVIGNPTTYGWYRPWLVAAEEAGFSLVSSGDSQSLWADPFVSLAVAGAVTSSARLGVTVSNPRTRHPAVVASALAALHDLTGGRVVYGISSGDSALRNLGLPPARVAEVGEFARAVKDLCAGREVTWQGTPAVVRWAACDVPVWLAAEGPKMQFLAGQIADGVLLSNALDPTVLERARENLAAGAASVGRSADDIEIWCLSAMCLADTERAGIHRLRSLLAGTANHVYRHHFEDKGVPEEYRAALLTLQQHYDSRHHASPATATHNADLVERLGLVDFLAERSVIAGPPEQCVERISDLARLGVTNLLIHAHANEPLEFMREFQSGITPHLSLAGSTSGAS